MATVGSPVWGDDVWGSNVWGAGVWPGSTVTEEPSSGGGARFGRGTRKRQPYVTHGRTAPVSDTLYKQMFPQPAVESTTVETTDEVLPVALLMAFMAIDQ